MFQSETNPGSQRRKANGRMKVKRTVLIGIRPFVWQKLLAKSVQKTKPLRLNRLNRLLLKEKNMESLSHQIKNKSREVVFKVISTHYNKCFQIWFYRMEKYEFGLSFAPK